MNLTQTLLKRLLPPLLTLAAAAAVRADWVEADGKRQTGLRISRIENQTVKLEDGSTVSGKITRAGLDRFAVPQGTSGIILADGTRLAGSVLERTPTQVLFFSVTAGRMDLTPDDVAGLFYEPPSDWRESGPGAPALITRTGETIPARRILWADTETVAILTDQGLRKFPVSSVSRVRWSEPAAPNRLTLRNGDILNGPVTFSGKHFTITLSGREHRIPLDAVLEIEF